MFKCTYVGSAMWGNNVITMWGNNVITMWGNNVITMWGNTSRLQCGVTHLDYTINN